jgi:hypothetical protein
MEENNS